MKLLPLLDKRSWDKEGRLKLSSRQMGRIVDEAAEAIGIQDKPPTKIGESWSDVHPNTLRKYWRKCMFDAKADPRAVLHMMGSNLPSILRGWEPTDKELLEAYEKAESKLSLDWLNYGMVPTSGHRMRRRVSLRRTSHDRRRVNADILDESDSICVSAELDNLLQP
jgi:hypothetical protein